MSLPGDIALDTTSEWAARNFHAPVIDVAGNHEYYGSEFQRENAVMRQAAEAYGIHFLDLNSVLINVMAFALSAQHFADLSVQPISSRILLARLRCHTNP